MSDGHLDDGWLDEYVGLPLGDRHAVERNLSDRERVLLRSLVKQRNEKAIPVVAVAPAKPNMSAYSTWLARRLVQVANDQTSALSVGVTEATRAALRARLSAGAKIPEPLP